MTPVRLTLFSLFPFFVFVDVDLMNVLDMWGLNGTFPETMCDRAGSGALYVIRFCDLVCDCCADDCLTTDPESNKDNQD